MSGHPLSKETIDEASAYGDTGAKVFRQRMDTVGDGSGTKDLSGVADEYFIAPVSGEQIIINAMRIIIQDTGDMPWDEFAAEGGALATGCLLKIKQVNAPTNITVVVDLTDGAPIVCNADLLSIGNVSLSSGGAGISILTCDVDFRELLGYPLRLNGTDNQVLSFEVKDNLAGLDKMEIWCSGLEGV